MYHTCPLAFDHPYFKGSLEILKMNNIELFDDLEKIVTHNFLKTRRSELAEFEKSTLPIHRHIIAVVEPANRDEIQKCIKLFFEKKFSFM